MAEELSRLAVLAGRWQGDETIYPSGDDPGGAARSLVTARMVLGDTFLMTEYEAEREGHLPYAGIGVTGWDDAMKCYTIHWFDSLGRSSALPATGSWDKNVLRLEQADPGGRIRYLYVLESPQRYLFRIERTVAGEWRAVVQGSYTRLD